MPVISSVSAARTIALFIMMVGAVTAGRPVHGETVQLRGYDSQVWAAASVQPRSGVVTAVQLAPLRNDSATSSEPFDPDRDRDDADRDGVPVAVLDAWFVSQLEATGRFVARNPDPADRQAPHLSLRVLHYQPPYRRGERSNAWQRVRSHWHSWFAEDPRPLMVSIEASWHDPQQQLYKRLRVDVDSDTCLRLDQAPVVDAGASLYPFADDYRHSAIGQASLAALNRIVAWLDAMHGYEQQALAVRHVRGDRLLLADPDHWLPQQRELTLYHRDHADRAIGTIRLAPGDGPLREAWPISMAPGSVRPGDWVLISQPTTTASIVPADAPAGNRCPVTEAGAEHSAAAGLDDSRHTAEPDGTVERPES